MVKQKIVTDFSREQRYKIAKLYAQGGYDYHEFHDEYHASASTFYSILESAVVQSIVPDDLVQAIQNVSISHSMEKVANDFNPQKGAEAAERGQRAWNIRMRKREIFTFNNQETVQYAMAYANSKLSKEDFCKENFMSKKLFDRTLKKAIINGLISDEDVAHLKAKSMASNDKAQVEKLFSALMKKREERAEAKRQKRRDAAKKRQTKE